MWLTVSFVEMDVVSLGLATVSTPDLPRSAARGQERARIESERRRVSIVDETEDKSQRQE
jgi:hypothetical protein